MALSVRKRGDVWYARGTVRVGKQTITIREFSTGCGKRSDAESAAEVEAKRIRDEILAGPEDRARSVSISDCILSYVSKPGGVRSYDVTRLDAFNDVIGHHAVQDASDAWREWMAKRGADWKPGTAARWRAVLQAALAHGCKARGFTAPTLPTVKQPVAEGLVYLTYEEQLRLLASYNKSARQVAIMLCYQGMRTAEALLLEWQHVNFTRRTLFIAKSKSGHSRTVPMHPVVVRRLDRVWRKRGKPKAGRVFLSTRGDPYRVPDEKAGDIIGGNPLSKAHQTARGKAGIVQPFRIHDWRHHFASHMVMNGCDLITLMKLGGWRTMKMVQRYAAVNADHMKDAIDKMR